MNYKRLLYWFISYVIIINLVYGLVINNFIFVNKDAYFIGILCGVLLGVFGVYYYEDF